MIGTKLAHFQIRAHLGSGGFGDVYEAIGAHAAGKMSDADLRELENALAAAVTKLGLTVSRRS